MEIEKRVGVAKSQGARAGEVAMILKGSKGDPCDDGRVL